MLAVDLLTGFCKNFSFYLSCVLICSVKVEIHFSVLVLFTFCAILEGKSCSGSGAIFVWFISRCFPQREKTRERLKNLSTTLGFCFTAYWKGGTLGLKMKLSCWQIPRHSKNRVRRSSPVVRQWKWMNIQLLTWLPRKS